MISREPDKEMADLDPEKQEVVDEKLWGEEDEKDEQEKMEVFII